MKKGLKSTKPAERKFWEDVKHRMDGACVSNNEERLVYFLEVYTKRNDVVPQSERSVFDQIAGVLKKWLLEFLGINRIDENKAAELLCDLVRAYVEEPQNNSKAEGKLPRVQLRITEENMQTQTQKNTQDKQKSSDMKSPEATEKSLRKEDLIRKP